MGVEDSVQVLSLTSLAIGSMPAIIGLIIMAIWSLPTKTSIYALFRMLGQLFLIGFLLTHIFAANSSTLVVLILMIMVGASSWIALRTVERQRKQLLGPAFLSILTGGGIALLIVTAGVLQLEPWYHPNTFIPLAGMAFANTMNSVSLAAERFYREIEQGAGHIKARNTAFQTAMIPMLNALFAVGLVSLPGMMTGQILSGVSPVVAVRYQIVVMCMLFGAASMSTAMFLFWQSISQRKNLAQQSG